MALTDTGRWCDNYATEDGHHTFITNLTSFGNYIFGLSPLILEIIKLSSRITKLFLFDGQITLLYRFRSRLTKVFGFDGEVLNNE